MEWAAYPFSRDLPDQGIKPGSPAFQVDSLLAEPPGKPKNNGVGSLSLFQGSSWPRNRTGVSCIPGGFFTSWATQDVAYLKVLYAIKHRLQHLWYIQCPLGSCSLQPVSSLRFHIWELEEKNLFYWNAEKCSPELTEVLSPLSKAWEGKDTEVVWSHRPHQQAKPEGVRMQKLQEEMERQKADSVSKSVSRSALHPPCLRMWPNKFSLLMKKG